MDIEQTKPTIGITPGTPNGTGYELILKAFEEPTLNELLTAIVYGSKEAAMQHRKATELQTNFLTIKNVEDAADNRLNILDTLENVPAVDFGQDTPEAEKTAAAYLSMALEEEELDAVVACPSAKPLPCPSTAMEVLLTRDIRIALADTIDIEQMERLHKILERDFGCRDPRIAIITEKEENLSELIQATEEKRICTYGPYELDNFLESRTYLHFDACITTCKEKATETFRKMAEEYGVRFFAGDDTILATPGHDARLIIAGQGKADPASLLHSIYTVTDVMRCRAAYDEARQNPLPKLFHDRRDEKRNHNIE